MELYLFFFSFWYPKLLLFPVKSEPVLLIKVTFIRDMQCCFEEITFSYEFFVNYPVFHLDNIST